MSVIGVFGGFTISAILCHFFCKKTGHHFASGISEALVMLPCVALGLGLGFSYGVVHI